MIFAINNIFWRRSLRKTSNINYFYEQLTNKSSETKRKSSRMTRENEGQGYNKEMTYPDDPVPSEPCRARRSADTRWTPGTPTKAIFPIFPFLFFPKLPFRSDENTDLGEHTRTRKCQISQGDFRLCRLNISPIRFPFYPFASENARQTPLPLHHPPPRRFVGCASENDSLNDVHWKKKRKRKEVNTYFIFFALERTPLLILFY